MSKRSSIALGFIVLILIGAILLSSPWARNAGEWGSFADSMFTACSAVCVTGLTVVDIAREYSWPGRIVLLGLVQIGCVGLMTLSTFMLVAIGRRLSLGREFALMNAYGVPKVRGLRGLIVWVVGSMMVIQGIGAAVIYWRVGDMPVAMFYSIMNFCNAGFSIYDHSLAKFADDPYAMMTMAALTMIGGIGFLVVYNLCTFKFLRSGLGTRGRLSLHAYTVLRFTFYLVLVGFLLFMLIEWNGTLGNFSLGKKLYVGFFQAITPRTCGFCVIPTESLHPLTRMSYEIMMFIGGAPGSAAGGIKITTLAVLVYTILAMCRGETETVIYRRVVSVEIVREAIVIVMALAILIMIVVGALFVTESGRGILSDALLFEAVSAVTTTGLSMGDTTARLSMAGRVVIMTAMFLGRLGALTVVMMIGDRESKKHVRYPNEEIVVG